MRLADDYVIELINGFVKFLNLDMELLQQKAQPLAFNLTLRRDYLRGAKGIHRQQASERARKRQETHESSLWTRQSLLQLSAIDHVAPQILADDKSKTNIRDYIWKFIKTCKDRQGALTERSHNSGLTLKMVRTQGP